MSFILVQLLSNWVLHSVFDPVKVAIILHSIFVLIRKRCHLWSKLSLLFHLRTKFPSSYSILRGYRIPLLLSSFPITLPFVYSPFVALTSLLYLTIDEVSSYLRTLHRMFPLTRMMFPKYAHRSLPNYHFKKKKNEAISDFLI